LKVSAESLHVARIAAASPGPVLVFLHHGLGSISLWRDFPQRLCTATGLPGLLYDRRGHGCSPAAPEPRTHRYLHDEVPVLKQFLARHDVRDFILVGHSDGATIALLYAAQHEGPPPLGIVSIAAHLFVEETTRAGIRRAVDSASELLPRLRKHHGTGTESLFWSWAGSWLAPSFDKFDIRGELRAVRCPVLAVQGLQDEYGTPAQLEAIRAAVSGPVQTRLIEVAGHDPHVQSPEELLRVSSEAIRSWIADRTQTPCNP
jgi:pimeloyl-ACP methyl ester carboxylesterase